MCGSFFMPKQAAEHSARSAIHLSITEAEVGEITLYPCSPLLPPIGSSSSLGQA